MTDYRFAHDGELDDALEIASALRGSFDVYHGMVWINADRGLDRCNMDGTFTAAELRSIADYMSPPEEAWIDMDERLPPEDENLWIIVYAAPKHGLPDLVSPCRWHPDAGWCVDELRDVTLWRPMPEPPNSSSEPNPDASNPSQPVKQKGAGKPDSV